MSKKVLGFIEEEATLCSNLGESNRTTKYLVLKNKLVPVVSVKEIEKKVRKRPCKSCDYWTEWLKELKQAKVVRKK